MAKRKPKIATELKDLPHVPVASLEPLQGNLKELTEREYNKLKKSIDENGVIVPFFVWLEEGKLIDGHQRQRLFMTEGWAIDVPVVYISAANEQDAKQKLLVVSSQYGKVTQEGWDEFTYDLDTDWLAETTHFDALPYVFEIEKYTIPDKFQDYDESIANGIHICICPECGHEHIKDD